MTIQISETTHLICRFELPFGEGNFLGHINKEADGTAILLYRFRYYVDDKAHDSDDIKSWYKFKGPSVEQVEKILLEMFTAMELRGIMTSEPEILHMTYKPDGKADVDTFMKALAALPSMHAKWEKMQ